MVTKRTSKKKKGRGRKSEKEYVLGGSFVRGPRINFDSFGTVSENMSEEVTIVEESLNLSADQDDLPNISQLD